MTLLAASFLTACDNENGNNVDVIWDITPVYFEIFITDSEGHDLLNPDFQNNLIKDITATYQGETYKVLTEQEQYEQRQGKATTRYYYAHFDGLTLRPQWNYNTYTYDDNYELVFGEFGGDENVDMREFTINLSDGHQVTLSYSISFRWKRNGDPEKKTKYYLNGQELTDQAGKVGNYHFQYTPTQGLTYIK